jgi:hypothetical protein
VSKRGSFCDSYLRVPGEIEEGWAHLPAKAQRNRRSEMAYALAKGTIHQTEAHHERVERLLQELFAPGQQKAWVEVDNDPVGEARRLLNKGDWKSVVECCEQSLLASVAVLHELCAVAYVELARRALFQSRKAYLVLEARRHVKSLLVSDPQHLAAAELRLAVVEACPRAVRTSDLLWVF